MERELIATVEGDAEQLDIVKLPLAMKELIFEKLSIQLICSSRIVCKEWNSILSSQSFLYSLSTQNPWLLICSQQVCGNWGCMAYCFSAQKWITLPLSFLPNPEGQNVRNLLRWGQGLLIFQETPTSQLFVCNPLMRSYAEIEIDLTHRFIHIVQRRNKDPYLVVCSNSEIFSFQIYHYFQDAWKIKFQFAGETESDVMCNEMVECNGVLFWTAMVPTTIVGYNIKDGGLISPVIVAPLPRQMVQDLNKCVLYIVSYGSSVLVVGIFHEKIDWIDPFAALIPALDITHPLFISHIDFDRTFPNRMGIVIWELFQDEEDKLVWKWKEFARMSSQSLPQYLDPDWWHGKCVCVGEYLCFSNLYRGAEGAKVFAYNLKEGFWQRLPPCKIRYNKLTMMSFEPKFNLFQLLGKLRGGIT
ncbi:uncharacterized protein LOC131067170 [Cryptomeria japonica]|uniref:uncharacterized protein LOC131067170 n=1 Tax=Cryptomeria japonica TaxID=3369 RepID=UPI0027DAAA72|nr:uncharacterized protein LOC131067170 [Cryptomeria japonica]